MAELIDRRDIVFAHKVEGSEEYKEGFLDGAMCVLDAIDEMPIVEAKPVVHAHWEEVRKGCHVCSRCKVKAPLESDEYDYMESLSAYCPLCGAQMDEEFASDNNVGSKTEEGFE